MKLKKLLAFVLTLSVCASLMAPMAFASPGYTGAPVPINLTAKAIGQSNGTYNVSYTASLTMNESEAKAFAVLLSGKSAEQMSKLVYECVLVGNQIGSSISMGAGEQLSDLFTMSGSGAAYYDLINATFDNSSVTITYKLSQSAISAWAGAGVEEIKNALQGKTVTFAQKNSVNLTEEAVNALAGQNGIMSYVEIYYIGDDMTKDRAAFGRTSLNLVPYVEHSDDDTGSTPSTPTTPVNPEQDSASVIFAESEDGSSETPITEEQFRQIFEGSKIEKTKDADGTAPENTNANSAKVDDTMRAYFPDTQKIINTPNGLLRAIVKMVSTLTNQVMAIVGRTAGSGDVTTVDPETGVITTVDTGSGTVTIYDPATGETTVEFIMPEGGVEFLVEYENVPYSPENTGVDALLNTDEHIVYTFGDNYGTWRPNAKITRAEIAVMIYRLLRNQNVETNVSFTDVPENAWYAKAVKTLAALGILKGAYGQFRPSDTITREEVTAICVRFATMSPLGVGKEFADLSSTAWAHDEIAKAAAFGWIIGYPDGTFLPKRALSRAEAVTLINRVLGRPGDLPAMYAGKGVDFPDVAKTFWGYSAIIESTTAHNYSMDADTYTETWID